MTTDILDLSEQLLPHKVYFPHPTFVPGRVTMRSIAPMALKQLRQLSTCSGDGTDFVTAMVEPNSTSDDLVSEGGLTIQRFTYEGKDGRRVVSWWATVSGLTFKVDPSARVYVEGVSERVILHDPKAKLWEGKPFRVVVWASESTRDSEGQSHPTGKSKTYPSYSAMISVRNLTRGKRAHGRVPAAAQSLLSITPTKPTKGKPRTSRAIESKDILESIGFTGGTRVKERIVTLAWDEATTKKLYGESSKSPQAVIQFDAPVEATATDIGTRSMDLLRHFGTEPCLVVYAYLMNCVDSDNCPQRMSAASAAHSRGKTLNRASDRKTYRAIAELLSSATILVTDPASGDGIKIPLFRPYGTAKVAGGAEVPLVTMHEALYKSMMATGHGIMIPRSIVKANLQTHEQATRIAMTLAHHWSLGWVTEYTKGKTLRRKLSVLLRESNITYDIDAEVTKRGTAYVRAKVAGWLDQATKEGWIGSWKVVKAGASPLLDLYEFQPSNTLRLDLNDHRKPALLKHQPAT